jgi:hypothetical protein
MIIFRSRGQKLPTRIWIVRNINENLASIIDRYLPELIFTEEPLGCSTGPTSFFRIMSQAISVFTICPEKGCVVLEMHQVRQKPNRNPKPNPDQE